MPNSEKNGTAEEECAVVDEGDKNEDVQARSQPSEQLETDQKPLQSTQVSAQRNRKRGSNENQCMTEEKKFTRNRNRTGGVRGSPFPKSMKSIQAYGDISSFVEILQPNTGVQADGTPLVTTAAPNEDVVGAAPVVASASRVDAEIGKREDLQEDSQNKRIKIDSNFRGAPMNKGK